MALDLLDEIPLLNHPQSSQPDTSMVIDAFINI
jgi:hypothetical protein